MAADQKSREAEARRRRKKLILLGTGIAVLFTIALLQVSFNLTFLRPETYGQTLTFAAFSALIFVGLIALMFVLLRTLIKLYVERQTGVPGSKFRTKMVTGALLLSLGPVIALFLFSYGLMNRSIDKWFSRPVEEVRQHTAEVTQLLTNYAGQNALSKAQSIAASRGDGASLPDGEIRSADGRVAPARSDLAGRVRDCAAGRTGASQLPGSRPVADSEPEDSADDAGWAVAFVYPGRAESMWRAAPRWASTGASWWRCRCRPSIRRC